MRVASLFQPLSLAWCLLVAGCGGSDVSIGEDASTDETGSPALGGACDKAGALGCAGHAQKLQLLCDGTRWTSNGVCPDDKLCDSRPGPTLGSCQSPDPKCVGKTPGVAFCDGSARRVCEADLLSSKATVCDSAELCAAGVGESCAKCLKGQRKCEGAVLKRCADDGQSFVTLETCESPALCSESADKCAAPACTSGDARCTVNTLELCNAARTGYDPVKVCLPGLCDAAGKECDDCKAGDKTCAGSTPRACDSAGHWKDLTPCSGATPSCSGGVCGAGACVSGEHRCSGDVLEKCNGTSTGFDVVKTCGAGFCNATLKQCDECKAGDVSCSGVTPLACDSSFHWKTLTACSGSTPYCVAGLCVASDPATTVTFPSTGSSVLGGTLLSGGGGVYFQTGDYVEEAFSKSAAITKLDINLKMSDATIAATGCAVTISWNVKVNGTIVGNYSWVAATTSADKIITKSYTFPAISPVSGKFTLRIEATSTLAPGCGSWNWYPGGTATLQ